MLEIAVCNWSSSVVLPSQDSGAATKIKHVPCLPHDPGYNIALCSFSSIALCKLGCEVHAAGTGKGTAGIPHYQDV